MAALNPLARWTVNVAVVGLSVLTLLLVAAGVVLPHFDRQLIIVTGGSMSPTIPEGSLVIINHQDRAQATVGDVVTILIPSSGTLFTHRIVEEVEEEGQLLLRTQGDANPQPDGKYFSRTMVLGKVELSVPDMGRVVAYVQSALGRAVLVSTLLLLLALRWFWGDLFGSRTARRHGLEGAPGPGT